MTKIMLVEDDTIMRSTLRDLLQLSGYKVVTAGHSEDAVKYLETKPVDLVMADFVTSEMNGTALLHVLRSDEHHAKCPVVMFTVSTDPKIQQTVATMGADAFVVRPITIDALLDAIQKCLD